MTEPVKAYWDAFLASAGLPEITLCIDVFAFGVGEEMAAELLGLVLGGQKRATASAMPYYACAGFAPPKPGDHSVVTDFAGNPSCIIRTAAISVQPFRDVTWEQAKREGEDNDLAGWRANHVKFFTLEGEAEGYAFDWDMPVLFEDFEVVYQ